MEGGAGRGQFVVAWVEPCPSCGEVTGAGFRCGLCGGAGVLLEPVLLLTVRQVERVLEEREGTEENGWRECGSGARATGGSG